MSKVKIFMIMLMGVMLVLVPTAVFSQSPSPPCVFYGTAYLLDGNAVSEGTVAAWISGEKVAKTTTEADGSYYMQVVGNYAGETVTFTVNDMEAQETDTWGMGMTVEKNLHATKLELPHFFIDPPSQTAAPGDTFAIDVVVNTADYSLRGCEVEVKYNSDVMSTSTGQITENNLLGGLEIGPNVENGRISYALASDTAVSDVSGSMMTIGFTVSETATLGNTYDIAITKAELRDKNNEKISPVITDNGTVTIGRKGDFNGDREIGLSDFVEFAVVYNSEEGDPNYNVIGDFNDSGGIDFDDFVAFGDVYGMVLASLG